MKGIHYDRKLQRFEYPDHRSDDEVQGRMTKRNNASNNDNTRRGEKSDLRKWQEALPVEQATCRDIHHAWVYQSVKRDSDGFIRRLACVTCGAFKLQHLDRNGYIDKSTYEYPEGYVRPAGSGRITADENAIMRILSITQAAQE